MSESFFTLGRELYVIKAVKRYLHIDTGNDHFESSWPFYVIPFYAIVKEHGTALYQFSYVPYTIFISIATAGVPLAVSKFISKYNALGEYGVGRKLLNPDSLSCWLAELYHF